MAYYSQTQKSSFSSFVLLSISVTFYQLLLLSSKLNSAEAVSFMFPQFDSGQKKLMLQGDAFFDDSNRHIVLNSETVFGLPAQNSVGRVLYETPIQIWDSEKGTETSFQTTFTFFINRPTNKDGADGFAFFLAPVDTQLPKVQVGGLLGIFSDVPSLESNKLEPVVAVEFDTFSNNWDPKDTHIGINVQTITSRKTKPWIWKSDYVTATITYYAFNTSLIVSAFYRENPSDIYTLSMEGVFLKNVLPEKVRVGFSATTGFVVEQHRVYSWFFSSEFPPLQEFPNNSSTTKGFNNTNLLTNYVLQA